MLEFLSYLGTFISQVFTFEFINGISVYTILFYNLLLISFWYAFVRRG